MDTLQAYSAAMADLVAHAAEHTVRVEARRRLPASGVVWSNDGLIVTTHHVVRRDDNIFIGLPDGSRVAATLIGRDPGTDIAVLRADASTLATPAWVGRDELRVGQLALAAARPRQSIQATQGIISALGAPWRGQDGRAGARFVQTDVLMYPGFSGGPLVTASGALAGINTSALRQGISITVPYEVIVQVVNTLLAHGKMPRGYLGVGIQPVRLADGVREALAQETGLMVMSVEADGPAAAAGLAQGDVIVALDGEPTGHLDALQALLAGDRVGATAPVRFVRGGQVQTVDIAIAQAD